MDRRVFVRRAWLALGALGVLSSPSEARPAASGWYAEGGLGGAGYLLAASDDLAPGPAIGVRVGRDLFSFLSLGIQLAASSHEATVPAPPEGEWVQLYRGLAQVRLGGRFDRIALYAEGGAGVGALSSNVLGKVMITEPGEWISMLFQAGAGMEYQLENRHYAVGLGVDGFVLPQFDALKGVEARAFLRYTY